MERFKGQEWWHSRFLKKFLTMFAKGPEIVEYHFKLLRLITYPDDIQRSPLWSFFEGAIATSVVHTALFKGWGSNTWTALIVELQIIGVTLKSTIALRMLRCLFCFTLKTMTRTLMAYLLLIGRTHSWIPKTRFSYNLNSMARTTFSLNKFLWSQGCFRGLTV